MGGTGLDPGKQFRVQGSPEYDYDPASPIPSPLPPPVFTFAL